jgi:phage portal protein BeeE
MATLARSPEICRLFGVPPSKVYQLDKAAYSTLEQQDQAYVNESIKPRITNICQACNAKLLFASEESYVRLRIDYSDMLQGDIKARPEFFDSMVNNGLMNCDEARAALGMGRASGGSISRNPVNTSLLDADGEVVPNPNKPVGGSGPGLGSDVMTNTGGGAGPLDTEVADQAVV